MPAVTQDNLESLCDGFLVAHPDFNGIYERYGYPPLWGRPASFLSLLHTILEQQVSRASAQAVVRKMLNDKTDLEADVFLQFADEQLLSFGFSRQKIQYGRSCAEHWLDGRVHPDTLKNMDDATAIAQMKMVKGIGNWTAQVYLLMTLGRPDIWPDADIALVKAYQFLFAVTAKPRVEEMRAIAAQWSPYRSIAARFLWWYYINGIGPGTGKKRK
jgi:DNA-3-methyladenine glycosylase II